MLFALLAISGWAQESEAPAAPASHRDSVWRQFALLFPPAQLPAGPSYKVAAHSGDEVYLETAFPIFVGQRMVIPPGSYVRGTVVQARRSGNSKRPGEMHLRFDTL